MYMDYTTFYTLGKKFGLRDHEITYMYVSDNVTSIIKNKFIPKNKKEIILTIIKELNK